jgi:MOSC domain-containing protein YiiM
MEPRILSVNVGRPRLVEWHGRTVRTAIFKEPVDGPIMAANVNLSGDDQADRRVHGGPDKSVYAYAAADYDWWSSQLGSPLGPGTFGENLTIDGIDLGESAIGDRWHVGEAVFEVAQPREPCFKLGIRMGDAAFKDQFEAARRPGAYLRIIEPGNVAPGDAITVVPATPPAIRIVDLLDDPTPEFLHRIVADGRVPRGWRHAAARALAHADSP